MFLGTILQYLRLCLIIMFMYLAIKVPQLRSNIKLYYIQYDKIVIQVLSVLSKCQ